MNESPLERFLRILREMQGTGRTVLVTVLLALIALFSAIVVATVASPVNNGANVER